MNKRLNLLIIIVSLVALSLVLGHGSVAQESQGEIDYYTCGMHPSVRISVEGYKKGATLCPICNMGLIPVHKEEEVEKEVKQGKILFYRNPMNPSITSKVPTKDEMGMDYIPVYEEIGGEDVPSEGVVSRVKIKSDQARLAGVETETIGLYHLSKEIRTVGSVAYDPELAIAQDEFISAVRTLNRTKEGNISDITERTKSLVESSKRKLRLLGLSDEQIQDLEQSRQTQTNLILPEKTMWIYGEAYEYELPWLQPGALVIATTASLPGEEFSGLIASIDPVVNPKTRSVTFRAHVDNPKLKLKPNMYVDVVIKSMYVSPDGEHMVLAIPKDALLDTGLRKIVWVKKSSSSYEGREVVVGPEATADVDGKKIAVYPVLRGLREGDTVVTKGNFLIDSQSQITGVAAAAYGGALGAEEAGKTSTPPGHQH